MLGEQINRLVDEIERVKSQINNSKASLRSSETRTGRTLIDPMLQALGWDTGDSSQVISEYNIGSERVDYALIGTDQKPVAIVEAKALNKPLDGRPLKQLGDYAKNIRRGFSVLTDGNKWELYDNSRRGSFERKRILTVSIAEQSSLLCAVTLLQLWRPHLIPDQPTPSTVPKSAPRPTRRAAVAPSQHRLPAPGLGWITLEDLGAERWASFPTQVRFPNEEAKDIGSWKSLLIEIAEWLVRDGVLNKNMRPLTKGPDSLYCLVNTRSSHPNGTKIFRPHKLSNGLFLATSGGAVELARKSRNIMEYLRKDLTDVHVRVG